MAAAVAAAAAAVDAVSRMGQCCAREQGDKPVAITIIPKSPRKVDRCVCVYLFVFIRVQSTFPNVGRIATLSCKFVLLF